MPLVDGFGCTGTCAEKHSLLTQLLPYTEKLSLDTFGCRVIQKAFEVRFEHLANVSCH